MEQLHPVYWTALLLISIGAILWGVIKWLAGIIINRFNSLLEEIKGSVVSLKECLVKNELSFEEFRASSESKENGIYEKIEKTLSIVEEFSMRMDALSTQMGAINEARSFEHKRSDDHENRIRELEKLVSEIRYKRADI